jgi:lipid A 3-O-deacylase
LNFSKARFEEDFAERVHFGIGATGAPALADETQKLLHDISGAEEPVGWNTQMPTEITLLGAYDRQWLLGDDDHPSGYHSDWAPHAGFALGNAITQVEAGMFWRFGKNMPDDFGPPRITALPNGAAYFRSTAESGWYVCAGGGVSYVAHNIFLDSPVFQNSPAVIREPIIGEAFLGYVHYNKKLRVSYTLVRRSRQFAAQSELQNFGAVTATMMLN